MNKDSNYHKHTLPQKALEMLRIANEAVAKAKAENRLLGLASPFWLNDRVYFELPDGTISDQRTK